jgi:hypothetical protein
MAFAGGRGNILLLSFVDLEGVDDLASTTETTSAAGGNKTNLGSGGGEAADSGGVTDVLVVTSSVRVLDGVHGNTTDLRPAVSLGLVLVVLTTSLEDGLLSTSTTGNETDGTTASGGNELLLTRRQLDGGAGGIDVVADDGGVLAGGAGKGSTVTSGGLDVEDDGTLGQVADGENVTDVQLSTATAVDELTSVGTLSSDEQLLILLVLVRVLENNLGERSSTSGIVNDLLNDTADVAVSLGKVQSSKLGGTLSVLVVRLEDSTRKHVSQKDPFDTTRSSPSFFRSLSAVIFHSYITHTVQVQAR